MQCHRVILEMKTPRLPRAPIPTSPTLLDPNHCYVSPRGPGTRATDKTGTSTRLPLRACAAVYCASWWRSYSGHVT